FREAGSDLLVNELLQRRIDFRLPLVNALGELVVGQVFSENRIAIFENKVRNSLRMYRIEIIVFIVHVKDEFRFGILHKFAYLGKLDERTKSSRAEIEGGRKALANLGDKMIAVWKACAIGHRVADEHDVDGLSPDPFRVVETPLVGLELGKRPRPLPTHDCRQIGHLPQGENSLAIRQIKPAIWPPAAIVGR